MSLNQIAKLFERDKSVISRHLYNIFSTKELKRSSTVAFFATVQDEGGRLVERNVEYFNLDAMLFVNFLNRNRRLFLDSGEPVINDIGLAALALLIAESNPKDKEILIRLTMNMLSNRTGGEK